MWQHKRGEGRSVGSTFLLCIMLYTYIYIYCYFGKAMRARIRRFKVYVWQRKRGEGPSVRCTPQCKRGVRRSGDVRPNALQSVELASRYKF